MRHLSTIALIALMLGFGQFVLANEATVSEKKSSACPYCSNPDSLTKEGCLKMEAAAEESVEEVEEVTIRQKKEVSPASTLVREVKEPEKISTSKKEESNSLTFSFLYYLFYKFSISDFFQAPSYNSISLFL